MMDQIDQLAIKTLKMHGVAAVNKANSGHPGIVLSAAPMMHTLFSKHLNYDPHQPHWINRDRFVLSAGHGSALLYAQLELLNLISSEDLKQFRQDKSITPGHPEVGLTPGVEATTGPLGQGIAMGVGMAVAEATLRARFGEINHKTYVLCGDGDLEEGVAMEALAFAGKQQLHNLIILHDSNDIQLDTPVKAVAIDNMHKRMEAIGFNYLLVKSNTVQAIDAALQQAKTSKQPTFIEIKTIIGEGAPGAGTSQVHGAPLGDDIAVLRQYLQWNEADDFVTPVPVTKLYQKTIFARGKKLTSNFVASPQLVQFLNQKPTPINVKTLPQNVATRVSSGAVISYLNDHYLNWIGGSADLASSTKAKGGDGPFSHENRFGRNILFGVREFAMAAIGNGIALHSNFWPFVSTFFVFSDYAKPALRLGALMGLNVTYVFTHDSIFVGEDGPTHQPVEQLAMLRSIPNFTVMRPADETEVVGAYQFALTHQKGPTAIVLTRQNLPSLATTSAPKLMHGPYYVHRGQKEWTIVASGSELAPALALAQEFDFSCISIGHSNDHITWSVDKAITIEAATTFGMKKYGKYNIGIDHFGASGPGDVIARKFGLDIDTLRTKIKAIVS